MTAATMSHPLLLPAAAPMTAPAPPTKTSATTKVKSNPSEKENKIARGRRERPCDACRRRKSKCVVTEGPSKTCAACGVHGQECTYLEDPQPRKRRLDTERKDQDSSKRGQYRGRKLSWFSYLWGFSDQRLARSTNHDLRITQRKQHNEF